MGYGKGEVEGQRGGEGGRRCFARGGLVFPMKILGIKCEQHWNSILSHYFLILVIIGIQLGAGGKDGSV